VPSFPRLMCFCFPLIATAISLAQTAPSPVPAPAATSYDPRITFAPVMFPDPVNAYRSSNGAPGPNYWQNEASYELHASLDTQAKQLTTTETITDISLWSLSASKPGCRTTSDPESKRAPG